MQPVHRKLRSRQAASFETLESRTLLTTLTVSGTAGPDSMHIWVPGDGLIHVGVGPGTATFSDTTYDRILIDTGGDRDTVLISGVGGNVTDVVLGAGDDSLSITGQTSSSLDGNFAAINIDAGGGADDVTLIDNSNTFDDSYFIESNSFGRDAIATMTHNNVERFDLLGGPGSSFYRVRSSAPTTRWFIQANDGSDILDVGDVTHPLDSIGELHYFGDGGFDQVVVIGNASATPDNFQIFSNGVFETTGTFGGLSFDDTSEEAYLSGGNFDDTFTVRDAMSAPWGLSGNGGSDRFVVGIGNLNLISAHLYILGGPIVSAGDFDRVEIYDDLRTEGALYTISATDVTRPSFGGMTYEGIEYLSLRAQTHFDFIRVDSTSCQVILDGAGHDDTIVVNETTSGAPVYILPSAGLDAVFVNDDRTGSAQVIFQNTVHLNTLMVNTGAQVRMEAGGAHVLVTRGLAIDGTGVLDLTDNDLILDYPDLTTSPMPALVNYIRSARAGGTWAGGGLSSFSAALASPANTTLGTMESFTYKAIYGPGATFAGEAIDNSAVLVKYTYYGDADFNGVVNFDDYSRTDAGFNFRAAGWLNGDFDGNGVVNFDDYSLIDLAFNTQGAAL